MQDNYFIGVSAWNGEPTLNGLPNPDFFTTYDEVQVTANVASGLVGVAFHKDGQLMTCRGTAQDMTSLVENDVETVQITGAAKLYKVVNSRLELPGTSVLITLHISNPLTEAGGKGSVQTLITDAATGETLFGTKNEAIYRGSIYSSNTPVALAA